MYSTLRTMITKEHSLYQYCLEAASASKRLYNAALFRVRNRFTGYKKTTLTENEKQVADELDALSRFGLHTGTVKAAFPYIKLEKLMRVTDNPD